MSQNSHKDNSNGRRLNSDVDPRAAEIDRLKAEVIALRRQTTALQSEIRTKNMEVAGGTLDFAQVQRSFDWRVFCAIRRFVNKLLPIGSRRFEVARGFLSILVAFHQFGFKAGIREGVSWVWGLLKAGPSFLIRRFQKGHFSLEEVSLSLQPVEPHRERVDVIVCVHNALEVVKRCLSSVVKYTRMPCKLIIVDDGSDSETAAFLTDFSKSQDATLIRNPEARGYTRAANQGLRISNSSNIILLNSDTEVTPGWVDRLIACAKTDGRIAAVGPLSNTASWQSIPLLQKDGGDWAENPLPEGWTPEDMARVVARYAGRVYPRLPFLNGFCLLFRRYALRKLGYFDENNFGEGYGEENDYALRAAKAGLKLAVADDAYVFHHQSKSYSHARRLELAARANDILRRKHGMTEVDQGVAVCLSDRVMQGVRARVRVLVERDLLVEKGRSRWEGKRVLFLLPILGAGGGAHVVIQEAIAMRAMGVDARLLNLRANQSAFEQSYPHLTLPIFYADHAVTDHDLTSYDAVIATHYQSVSWLQQLTDASGVVKGYYIQDYEPLFFKPHSLDHMQAKKSYTLIPDLVRFTKTKWNKSMVEQREQVTVETVGPSVDIDLFRPRTTNLRPGGPLRIAAMIRPVTPRRAPELTMHALRKIEHTYGLRVSIHIFGCSPAEPEYQALPRDFRFHHAGTLNRFQMARFFSQIDIFADFSSYQAMGLTALEAMACGAAVIVPQEGGSLTFARHGENSLCTDTRDERKGIESLETLIENNTLRQKIQQRGLFDVCEYYPEKAAFNILQLIFR